MHELVGNNAIIPGWGRIAAGVIMDSYDRGGPIPDSLGENLAWMDKRRIEKPACYQYVPDEAVLAVEHQDVELLDWQILKTAPAVLDRVAGATNWSAL